MESYLVLHGKVAEERGKNGRQTYAHLLVTRISSAEVFFAALGLCVEIPLTYRMETAKAQE